MLARITDLLGEGDVIAIDGKALRGARDKGESGRTRMMVSAYAARLRLTLATVAADNVLCRENLAAQVSRSWGIRFPGRPVMFTQTDSAVKKWSLCVGAMPPVPRARLITISARSK